MTDEAARWRAIQIPDLAAELRQLLRQIPKGRVSTYGTLAKALGSSRAARWVGEFMVRHDHSAQCPCHRVIRATGEPGLYVTGNGADKLHRLQAEGIPIIAGKISLTERGFDDFSSTHPLEPLEQYQHTIFDRVRLAPLASEPVLAAGLDVSYRGRTAVAACVLFDIESGETVWQTTVSQPVRFPYIPGFLAFRELPGLLTAWQQLKDSGHGADVALIDGNGILHPHRAGVATLFGIVTGMPSIGVSKKLLCGRVDLAQVTSDSPQPVIENDELIGHAVVNDAGSRPLFVSPGHNIAPGDSIRVVRACFVDHRLPEPTFLADQLSRRVANSLSSASST